MPTGALRHGSNGTMRPKALGGGWTAGLAQGAGGPFDAAGAGNGTPPLPGPQRMGRCPPYLPLSRGRRRLPGMAGSGPGGCAMRQGAR
ncbi:hypothetical protein D5045_01930 [Verminephrobacter eiseniae]|nr:hypothetical protein [Verminephrobacter eiseniae]